MSGFGPRPETPEDFRVDELPLYPASGEGPHTFVQVEKRLRNTEQVARDLARAAGVPPREVGFAGRKDRFGVTSQWFSIPGLDPARALGLALPGARVLAAVRHAHKLRTGHLRGNRFRIGIPRVSDALCERARRRLEELCRLGMPNRFGSQRFGRDGRNAARGRRVLLGEAGRADRRTARFLVSALQAAVFNEALVRRAAPLDAVEAGDVAVVHASGGLFRVEDPARERPRAAAFEISATGPIFGARVLAPAGAVAQRERQALAALGLPPELPRPPPGLRLRGARRPLRARPQEAGVVRCGDGIEIRFTLPAGSFGSVLVEELFGCAPEDGSDDTRGGSGVC